MAKKRHYCSFCGKDDDEVEQMLSGPCVEVCNECVDTMYQIRQVILGVPKEASYHE